MSNYIYELVGEVKITFNIICINNSWSCMKKWIIPTLSKNFYFEYSNDNARFGEIVDYEENAKSLDEKGSILSMIKTIENINYLYEHSGYNNSGDKIILQQTKNEKEENQTYKNKFNQLDMKKFCGFNTNMNERIKYVLENNDMYLCSFLKVKCIDPVNINENLLLSKFKFCKTISRRIVKDIKSGINCSICFENIYNEKEENQEKEENNLPVYITKCAHIFHINCISKGILQNYYDYYNAMKNKLENLIEYDIFGNLIRGQVFNCPNCRKDLFSIKLDYNTILDVIFDDTYKDFIISKKKYKTKTIFS